VDGDWVTIRPAQEVPKGRRDSREDSTEGQYEVGRDRKAQKSLTGGCQCSYGRG
jgi:hypothetical protein